jgi:alkanesulfonate monooxygenase SsuD/methylene tetrahydromethanopterin reductase-like flavin-dependent oxidoreductase (luciferase family)
MSQLGITMPMLNTSLRETATLARYAEDGGFDSVWGYEFYRTAYSGLAAAAEQTSRIKLGTGLSVALTRTPFVTANAAADIDELSDGRTLLGLGTGSPEFLHHFHDIREPKPLARMRDYLAAVRASWHYLETQEAGIFEGTHQRLDFPDFMPFGTRPLVRSTIPIYLAGERPKMIQLAGEIDIASEIICAVHPDRSIAMRRARIQVGMYAAHPVGDAIVARNGLEKEQQAVREALLLGGVDALEDTTPDALIEALSISGTPDECRDQLRDYERVLPHVLLHTPYVPPLRTEESQDAFRQIIDCFRRA